MTVPASRAEFLRDKVHHVPTASLAEDSRFCRICWDDFDVAYQNAHPEAESENTNAGEDDGGPEDAVTIEPCGHTYGRRCITRLNC